MIKCKKTLNFNYLNLHSCGVPLISKICGRIFDAAASIRSICLEEPTNYQPIMRYAYKDNGLRTWT